MVRLYVDVHVHGAITRALRQRGADVLTAQADGMDEADDPELLDRATELGRVLFSQDQDLLIEGARRQQAGESFPGVIYAHQRRVPLHVCIEHLELACLAGEPPEFRDMVRFLPL